MSTNQSAETPQSKRKPDTLFRKLFRTLFVWLPILYLVLVTTAWLISPSEGDQIWFLATPQPERWEISPFAVEENSVQPISYTINGAQWEIYGNANNVRDVTSHNGRIYKATGHGLTVFDANTQELLHHITLADGLPSHNITAVAICVWDAPLLIASTMQGVVAIDISISPPLVTTHWTTENSGLSDNSTMQGALACSPQGTEPAVYISHPRAISIYHPLRNSWSQIESKETQQILATVNTLWLSNSRDLIQYDLTTSANKELYARGEENFPTYGAHQVALAQNRIVSAISSEGLIYGVEQPDGRYRFSLIPLPDETIRNGSSLLITKNDEIWLALSNETVCLYDRDQESCDPNNSYTLQPENSQKLVLLELENGRIGISIGSKFYEIDQANNQLITKDLTIPHQAPSNKINVITQSENDLIVGGVSEFSHIPLNRPADIWTKSIFYDARVEINDLQLDREGNLWMATYYKLFHLSNRDKTIQYPLEDNSPGSISDINSLTIDSHETVWVGTQSGLFHWKRNSFRDSSIGTSPNGARSVVNLVTDHDAIWVAYESGDLIKHTPSNGRTTRYAESSTFPHKQSYPDRSRHLVVAGDTLYATDLRKLWRYEPQQDLFVETGLEILHSFTALAYDPRSDTLYIGTDQEGIFTLHNNQFHHIIRKDQLPLSNVQTLFVDTAGDLWISVVQHWPQRISTVYAPKPEATGLIRYSPASP